ncbi:MAG: hypothetical protein H0X70_06175 [Segetibacter sp.]|jgi:hypothetical protein|nr:hypothetical protein [Segetibacter sp.]
MNKQNNSPVLSAALLIVFAAFTRLFPHPENFTALGAMAVFGGSVIKDKKLAFLLPLSALLLSDVCLQLFTSRKGFYGTTQFFVYAAFILITLLATFIRKKSVVNIAFAAVWSALIFFVISNFGVWVSSTSYAHNITGLLACYAAAIPFYKNELFGNFVLNSIMGNLFFSALLFSGYYVYAKNRKFEEAIA